MFITWQRNEDMKKIATGLILFIVGAIVPVICLVKRVDFMQNCGGYLKQAADANTIEMALGG